MRGNFSSTCSCQNRVPCNVTPIVMPQKERVICRYYSYEQPIIVPCHTKIVNTYYPRPCYYPQYTTSEEDVCPANVGQNLNPS